MAPPAAGGGVITVDKRAGPRRAARGCLGGRGSTCCCTCSSRCAPAARHGRGRPASSGSTGPARELQWLFTNERIAPRQREHVLDSPLGFARALGVEPGTPAWNLPLPGEALEYARTLVPETPRERLLGTPGTLVISACSSHALRNWRAERYAAVARQRGAAPRPARDPRRRPRRARAGDGHRDRRAQRGAGAGQRRARHRCRSCWRCCARASVLLSPDSGPVHMATMVGLPVIGLYAATNRCRAAASRPVARAHRVDA